MESVIEIAVRPLGDVLDDYVPVGTKIDFLSIDVEGLEEEVIATLDFNVYRPDAICFERLHRKQEQHTGGSIESVLEGHGYLFCAATVHSVIYVVGELVGGHLG